MPKPVSKADEIRAYLTENKKASAKEVVDALAAKGIKIKANNVYRARTSKKKTIKTKTNRTSKKPAESVNGTSKGKSRPFPQRTLEQALEVPTIIRLKNHGRPWPPDQVAKALDLGPLCNEFFYLCAASRDYGLTIGSRDTESIA